MHKASFSTVHPNWLFFTVGVHAAIGASMVPMRYLQAVVGLPGLALVALSDVVAFTLMAGRVFPRIEKRHWQSRTLWTLVAIVVVRTIFITFAIRFTKVYIVQLISLLAPFLVVLLNRIFIKTPLPKYTILAITLSVIGGTLMVFGGMENQSTQLILNQQDGLGILFALIGTFGVAGYMMIVKRSQQISLPYEVVYIAQIGTMMLLLTVFSFAIGEDWSRFADIDVWAILAFFIYAVGMEIGCKLGNISVLRKLGAPMVSSMLAIRLVAALIFGWLVLGERLESGFQWVGAFVVIVTVTGYLASQKQVHPVI